MSRKVIIDCDPGIDDAIALMIALFDPRLDVVAVTSTAGNVNAEQAYTNLQALIEFLDPPRRPRIGMGPGPRSAPPVDSTFLHGSDGLAELNLAAAKLHQTHPAEKLISDKVREFPEEITLLCLGPFTNIANCLQRDPTFASQVGQIVMMGGSLNGVGNVTPCAEFNCHFDAESARRVFHSKTTKTLVPIDITSQVTFSIDLLDHIPKAESRATHILNHILPFSFRSHRRHLAQEGILLNDAVALVALLQPELFEAVALAGDVETQGDLTLGATIFDQRTVRTWTKNMEVMASVDSASVKDCILRGIILAAKETAS
ncbi:nucleoside hydrolase [Bremerella cremea]|uniref:Nucleoside hydrolase n=1 Tax=Bremerella cremea TaxID=1031537 RepID=A0A368KTA4_9BACT|nr:nucleoside hydrolase [Bremerella cremea]RCS49340.1 nucleoside hydrolase [Bremerella cremea]